MTSLAWMRPKLAELCGPHFSLDGWRPDEDVAQAIRCAVAAGFPFSINYDSEYHFQIDRRGGAYSASLPRAICLGIAAAMGWKDDRP